MAILFLHLCVHLRLCVYAHPCETGRKTKKGSVCERYFCPLGGKKSPVMVLFKCCKIFFFVGEKQTK